MAEATTEQEAATLAMVGGGLGEPVKPQLVLCRGAKGEQHVVAQFPTAEEALLAVRLVGMRRQYPIMSAKAEGGGVPLVTNAEFMPRLAFGRPAHKTQADLDCGTNRGHLVELHWHSSTALLHEKPSAAVAGTSLGSHGDGWQPPLQPGAPGSERSCYLLSTGFLRPGYSTHRLLAMHPTLLPTDDGDQRSGHGPMVAELMILAFAREVSWLIGLDSELAGAEVGSGDDATLLLFTTALSEKDIELLNTVRATLSDAMGPKGLAANSGGDRRRHRGGKHERERRSNSGAEVAAVALALKRGLAQLLVCEKRTVWPAGPPPKPWRKVQATQMADWDQLWAPLLQRAEAMPAFQQQQAAAVRGKPVPLPPRPYHHTHV